MPLSCSSSGPYTITDTAVTISQLETHYYLRIMRWLYHSCQVSQNDQDSPGISAPVPVVSWLTQKRTNVPEFL